MNDLFPKHEAGLTLSHNEHKNVYQTVEIYTEGPDEDDDFISEEERQLAYKHQDFWELQWYPNTPVGFNRLRAFNLDKLLKVANDPNK